MYFLPLFPESVCVCNVDTQATSPISITALIPSAPCARESDMKVTVFFEAKAGAHVVAQFDEESTYMACLPALEALAKSQGYIVTESLDNGDQA